MSARRSARDTSQISAAPTGGESAPPAAAIESSTTADRSSGRKSSRPPSKRRVVSRSEPLRETPATDTSCETRPSAPASTGDTSLLVEQPTVRELVLARLSATDKRLLFEGGTPRHELSGTSGPLRPEVTLRRREIVVTQYTPAAWRSQVAWHAYWGEHGGFGDANLDNEQLMAGSPPTPRRDHRKVRVTWGQARTWVREEAGAGKASSDTSRAAAGGPGRGVGLSARTRHDLDRTAQRLRDRFASRPARRGPAGTKWAWTNTEAQACEASIRETLGDATRPAVGVDSLERRARAAIATARRLLGSDATAAFTPAADSGVRLVWWPVAQGTAPRGDVLLKALPAGRLARPAEVQASIPTFPAA